MFRVSKAFGLIRLCLRYICPVLVILATVVALSTATHMALADEAGNSAICTQECNYDSNGSNGSCYSSCMANRRLYDNDPSSTNGPMPSAPTLYSAIAVETDSLTTGYMKDVASREDAEQGALAYCRKEGGINCKVVVSFCTG
jgi:Domain of unknown function (DUF4189)